MRRNPDHWLYRDLSGARLLILRLAILAVIFLVAIVIPGWFR